MRPGIEDTKAADITSKGPIAYRGKYTRRVYTAIGSPKDSVDSGGSVM